jgi:four helix bundle protein
MPEGRLRIREISSNRDGSASELEYHLLLARDIGILVAADHERLSGEVIEVKKILASLIRGCRAGS